MPLEKPNLPPAKITQPYYLHLALTTIALTPPIAVTPKASIALAYPTLPLVLFYSLPLPHITSLRNLLPQTTCLQELQHVKKSTTNPH